MAERALIELSEEAVFLVERFVDARLEEWKSAIDPILKATGQPEIGSHTIQDLLLVRSGLYIATSSFSTSNSMFIPRDVLESQDINLAANLYRINMALEAAEVRLNDLRSQVVKKEGDIKALRDELNTYMTAGNS